MIVLYTPPPVAIVPIAPACVRRESTWRRKPRPVWRMADNYEAQCQTHADLLRAGWTPIRWEVVA